MIPDFDATGNLPPGIHDCSWKEFTKRFGQNGHRLKLLDGLGKGIAALKAAGCKTIYVGGSFVSAKVLPGDFDACWDEAGVDLTKMDSVLLTFANRREAQKKKYHGEFFPATLMATSMPLMLYLDFFQKDKHTNQPKGIIKLTL